MREIHATALCLLGGLAVPGDPQGIDTETALEYDTPIEVEIEVSAPGTLYAWAASTEVDVAIEVLDAAGESLASDDDSGGGMDAYLSLAVEDAGPRVLVISADGGEEGAVRFGTCVLADTPESLRRAAELRAATAEIRAQLNADSEAAAARLVKEIQARADDPLSASSAESQAWYELTILVGDARNGSGDPVTLAALQAQALTRVVAETERRLPPRHKDLVLPLLGLGEAHATSGRIGRALPVLRRALNVAISTSHYAARARALLGATLVANGDHLGASELFRQILEEAGDAASDIAYADVRQNLATCHIETGDALSAVPLAESVLADYEVYFAKEPLRVAIARRTLATALIWSGDPDKWERGERELALVTETYEAHLGPSDPRLIDIKELHATVLGSHGRFEEALRMREALYEVARDLPEDHPTRLRLRCHLLANRRQVNRGTDQAREFQEVLEALRRQGSTTEMLSAIHAALLDRIDAKDAEGIRALAEEACAWIHREASLLASSLSPRRAEVAAVYPILSDGLDGSLSAALGAGIDQDLFRATESLRAIALRAAQATRSLKGTAEGEANLARRAELTERLVAATRAGATAERQAELRRELDEVQRKLASAGVAAEELPMTPGDLAGVIGQGAALVSYRRYPRRIELADGGVEHEDAFVAFALNDRGELSAVDLGPAFRIEEAADDWRAAVLRGDDELARRRGVALSKLVLAPALDHAGDVKRLVVVPDDVLHTVPFDALPDGDALLGSRLRLEVRSSVWELLSARPGPDAEPALAAFGAVDYELGGGRRESAGPLARLVPRSSGAVAFAPLPGTGPEVRTVERLFREHVGGDARVFTGARANRTELREAAAGASYLHLATHGYSGGTLIGTADEGLVERMHPMMLCGLALAGANEAPDATGRLAGILTAEELSGLDLRKCELAVLSACETHGGIAVAGQGLASLQKAARMAGARSVITSLWRVDDAATGELMEEFYRRMWVDGLSKADALWAAKEHLQASGRPTRDWAGWVLTGEPN